MYKIKLLNKISQLGLSVLPSKDYTCAEDIENPQGIIVRSAKMHDMQFGSELLAIARAGAGVNNIPLPKCSDQGIVVFNTPGANANAVKELTILGLILSARNVFPAMQWAQGLKGKGDEVPPLVEKGKSNFIGPELSGKKLGVIGLGKIGQMVANAAFGLGMEVYGHDPLLTPQADKQLHQNVHRIADIGQVYSQCDFITLHLPSTEQTKGMINAQSLGKMKKGVVILNFARGDLVQNADMIASIDSGHAGNYLTDFPDESLLGHPGVLAIPHLGASTPESEENCAIMASDQIRDYLENANIINSVNFPAVQLPASGKPRIAVISKGADDIVSRISELSQVEIVAKSSGQRDDIGYVIMDFASAPSADLAQKISAIDGVLRVRQL